MKVGVIFGKFAPLHLGHIHAINYSATLCDKLYVVLCHSEEQDKKFFLDQGLKPVPYKERLRWLLEVYQDIEHVYILTHDENHFKVYPHGWIDWSASIKKLIPERFNILFSSEKDYQEGFKKYFPECETCLIDPERNAVPISASQIRKEGIFKHWEKLPGVVRPYFAKKVVVVGTESCGKTTLVKYLAKKYNTSWVEEYGRIYTEKNCFGREDLLVYDDYPKIAYTHKIEEEKALRTANKLVFIDTEAIITQYYCYLYEGKKHPLVDEIIKLQNYDMWLYLEPDVKWIDDGIRSQGTTDKRVSNNELLKSFIKSYLPAYTNVYYIKGSYNKRFQQVVDLIHSEFGIE